MTTNINIDGIHTAHHIPRFPVKKSTHDHSKDFPKPRVYQQDLEICLLDFHLGHMNPVPVAHVLHVHSSFGLGVHHALYRSPSLATHMHVDERATPQSNFACRSVAGVTEAS